MTTQLIDVNSLLYAKRLVRELNSLPDGFYFRSMRGSRARVHNGIIQFKVLGYGWTSTFAVSEFRDAYGREVCASRKA